MKKDTICKLVKRIFPDSLYFYVAIIAGIVFLHITVHDYVRGLYTNYLIYPIFMFLGAALERKTAWKSKWNFLLPVLMVGWFLLLQVWRVLVNEEIQNICMFLSTYLFAFPLASLLQDGDEKKALKIFAGVYLVAAATFVADTALLFADSVPSFFSRHIFWNGARLNVIWHANITACFLLIAIAFCTIFFTEAKSRWLKLGLVILIALMLGVMALTNCRAIIILTGGYLVAQIFFALIKRGGKWFVPGVVAVLAVTVLFFVGAKYLYQLNGAALDEKYVQQTEQQLPAEENAPQNQAVSETASVKRETNSPQGTFQSDLLTLNNRTHIWKATYTAIRENPAILLWGVSNPGAYVSSYNFFSLGHLHNAWIECLAALGVVGLVFALLFTVMTAWNCLIIFLKHNQDIWRRNVALLALCLMGASVLEPYLFFSDFEHHLVDFLFFICAGYLVHWQEADNRQIFLTIRAKLFPAKKEKV